LLIKEAGGIISDFSGNSIHMDSKSLVGANKSIHSELMAILGEKIRNK